MQQYLVPIIIGLIAGGITLLSLLSQLRTVVKQHAAADYVNPGSLKLGIKTDQFLTRKVEREAIQRQTPASPSSSHQ